MEEHAERLNVAFAILGYRIYAVPSERVLYYLRERAKKELVDFYDFQQMYPYKLTNLINEHCKSSILLRKLLSIVCLLS